MQAPKVEEIFSAYLQDYCEEMRGLPYHAFRQRQDHQRTSFAFGAAGVAYSLWYAGLLLEDGGLLEAAERWIRSALLAQHGPLAFVRPGDAPMPPFAYMYGRAGLYFVRALVARSRDDHPRQRAAVRRFIELCRQSQNGPAELYRGAAGCLSGTAILLRHCGERELCAVGEELALRLHSELARGEEPPGARVDRGLAHGTAGIYLSLLLWASATNSVVPAWISRSLESFIETTIDEPSRLCPRESVHAWLCNGFAGLTLLAVKAHEVLGQPSFAVAAHHSMRLALVANPPSRPDLCCGRAGVAVACLALSRLDPSGPWRHQAEQFTLSTLLVDREDWPLAGLYGGEAAIPWLVLNLLSGITSGPPGLDFIEPAVPAQGPARILPAIR